MKFYVSLTVSVLIAAVIISLVPCMGEADVYDNVLRLHVIAESDSAEDQDLKLKVRDAVLRYVSDEIKDCASFQDTYNTVSEIKQDIQKVAEQCVEDNGFDCGVSVALDREEYPYREYDNVSLPRGEYNSLRVILGEGEGKNWWCVLFPSMCIGFAGDDDEYAAVGFTPREYRVITGNSKTCKIRFKILEVLSEVIGFKY